MDQIRIQLNFGKPGGGATENRNPTARGQQFYEFFIQPHLGSGKDNVINTFWAGGICYGLEKTFISRGKGPVGPLLFGTLATMSIDFSNQNFGAPQSGQACMQQAQWTGTHD